MGVGQVKPPRFCMWCVDCCLAVERDEGRGVVAGMCSQQTRIKVAHSAAWTGEWADSMACELT